MYKYSSHCFSGALSIGSGLDQTRVPSLSSPRTNPESSFGFSLCYSAGPHQRKSQHLKKSLPVIALWFSVYSKIHQTVKVKLNHRSKF